MIIFLISSKLRMLANYAAGSTMSSSDPNINNIMTSFNHDFAILPHWFYKLCSPQFWSMLFYAIYTLLCCFQTDLVSNNVIIINSKREKVLGITFDNKLEFSTHLTSITKQTISSMLLPENKNTWLQSKRSS